MACHRTLITGCILTYLVNRSLQPSIFPSAWKISEVAIVPLVKEGDHEVSSNNRPVSLFPAMSKVCERIVLNQLNSYMIKEKRLTRHQSGNKHLHSCETLGVLSQIKCLMQWIQKN